MSYRVEKDTQVPMRDGETLATDLWIPDARPTPALLVRTPYGKDVPNLLGNALNFQALLEAGYAVVHQDVRGTYRSGGEFVPLMDEPHNGADTVAWVAGQPWCDGRLATFGASYLGWVQWGLAAQGPAALKAIAPAVTTADYYAAPWYSEGGALSLHMTCGGRRCCRSSPRSARRRPAPGAWTRSSRRSGRSSASTSGSP